jgi:hypothetical protein
VLGYRDCAAPPAQTVAHPNSFWQEKTARIGVVLVEVPKGAVHMVGPQDALDRAIANATDARLRIICKRFCRVNFIKLASCSWNACKRRDMP